MGLMRYGGCVTMTLIAVMLLIPLIASGNPTSQGPSPAVDGGWSEWGEWQNCLASCCIGNITRYRTCDNPPPQHGGAPCNGTNVDRMPYDTNVTCQAVNGSWSEWGAWQNCSASCGIGNITRYRTCDNPPPQHGGTPCDGTNVEWYLCDTNITCQAVNGSWSEWGAWQNCSASCGIGNITRYRTCDNPPPQHGGTPCDGTNVEWYSCDTNITCQAVNGSWSEWGEWQNCSASCGIGNITRYRTCDNPPPQHGGAPCVGADVDWYPIDTNVTCPVDGGWSDWSTWSACSVTCGDGGQTTRRRNCTNPPPMYGGQDCDGESIDHSACDSSIPACQAEWAEWSAWGACLVRGPPCSERTGVKLRKRECLGTEEQCDQLTEVLIQHMICTSDMSDCK